MTFKNNWEKTEQHIQIHSQLIQEIVGEAFPQDSYVAHEVISGGCANLNIKINLHSSIKPFILRVYLRDSEAAYREKKLAQLLEKSLPIPKVHFVGVKDGHHFAITEYMPGVTLRDLLLNGSFEHMEDLMTEAGTLLGKIHSFHFPHSGFFDYNLKIKKKITQESHIAFARKCLQHPTTVEHVGEKQIASIRELLEKYAHCFPNGQENSLVHGDFDPANILVDQQDGKWKISAILDWEFAFSGSLLCDLANMLRYSHQMPDSFEESFLKALEKNGMKLPENWRISIHLLNLISLLDCLTRCPPKKRPHQCKDICELIAHIIEMLHDQRIC